MRKNIAECLDCFVQGVIHLSERDKIYINRFNGKVVWSLHGYTIAWRNAYSSEIHLSTEGYNTPLTWSRLNAVSGYYGLTFKRMESTKWAQGFLQMESFKLDAAK
jgi:hypothetical protein